MENLSLSKTTSETTINLITQAATVQEVAAWVNNCTACGLRSQATQVTYADGSYESPIMFVGMNPAFAEDGSNIPFCGKAELERSRCNTCVHMETCYSWFLGHTSYKQVHKCKGWVERETPAPQIPQSQTYNGFKLNGIRTAGQIFDDVLMALNIDRRKIFITNGALCKSDGNAAPGAKEYNACSPIRLQTERTLRPDVIVTLGNAPYQLYSSKRTPMSRIHGVPFNYQNLDHSCVVVPTYHPAYIMRQMENTSGSDLIAMSQIREKVNGLKWDLFSDLTNAFNLLDTEKLAGLVRDSSKLVDGKLPVKSATLRAKQAGSP